MSKRIPYFPVSRRYRPVARELFQVDKLEEKEMPRYHRDIASKSYVIPKRGGVPPAIVETEDLYVPTIELASNPMVKMNRVADVNFDIGESMRERSADSLDRQEDVEAFKTINAAIPSDHTVLVETFDLTALRAAITLIEEHELFGGGIVMNKTMWYQIDSEKHPHFKPVSPKKVRKKDSKPIYGYFYDIPIYVSTMCPKNMAFVVAEKEYVGVIPIRTDHTVLPADDPKKLRLGWVIFRELGFGVVNDYACARVLQVKNDVPYSVTNSDIRGANGQSASLFEVRSSSGEVLFQVNDTPHPSEEIDLSEDGG